MILKGLTEKLNVKKSIFLCMLLCNLRISANGVDIVVILIIHIEYKLASVQLLLNKCEKIANLS